MNDSNHMTWVILDRDGNLCESFESFNAARDYVLKNLITLGPGDELVEDEPQTMTEFSVRFLDGHPAHRAYAIHINHTRRYGGLATDE